jgi:hypothetical protein
MSIVTTKYYDEFLRYSKMAAVQQAECNLGIIPHDQGTVKDPLMCNVKLYDVVERKYAGFTQLMLDVWYGNHQDHPYSMQLHDVRKPICEKFNGWRIKRTLPEMLYVFLVHRLAGSAINYSKSPSGYHNTVIPEFYQAETIKQMAQIIKNYKYPKYTSIGYQFPAFPKPSLDYIRGGDYFMCEILPELVQPLAEWLAKGEKKDLREIGSWMFAWNRDQGLRAYKFQYAAFISDIADFYPEYVNVNSPFYYGTNAVECIKYMVEPGSKLRGELVLDAVMEKAVSDTGYSAYNVEDQMCDAIRWIENYIRPGSDYDHLNYDEIWSSSTINDHPFGRQKNMLKLGLIDTFNGLGKHPSDDYVLSKAGMSVPEYKRLVSEL